MTETPVPKLILQLAVPTIISMLVTGIYNTADTYFVGRISENATGATAAVGIVFPLMAIIQAFGFLFGHGSGNFLSRSLGAGKKKEASEMASTGFAMALIFGLFIALFGNILMGPILDFLAPGDVTASTLSMTDEYARIILIGAPFMMCQFVVNNQLRFQGSKFQFGENGFQFFPVHSSPEIFQLKISQIDIGLDRGQLFRKPGGLFSH